MGYICRSIHLFTHEAPGRHSTAAYEASHHPTSLCHKPRGLLLPFNAIFMIIPYRAAVVNRKSLRPRLRLHRRNPISRGGGGGFSGGIFGGRAKLFASYSEKNVEVLAKNLLTM